MSLIVLLLLGRIAGQLEVQDVTLPGMARAVLRARFLWPAAALPAMACGAVLVAGRRVSWAWTGCSAALLIGLCIVVLAAAVAIIAPLYLYRPL
jgi:hypothetical protein